MANNCSKAKNDTKIFNAAVEKLGHRSIAHLINNIWKSTIVATAADVDGRGCYPNMKAGHLVVGKTSAQTAVGVFICTVAPNSSTNAGTFVMMHA